MRRLYCDEFEGLAEGNIIELSAVEMAFKVRRIELPIPIVNENRMAEEEEDKIMLNVSLNVEKV
jgi:hypothetical protein